MGTALAAPTGQTRYMQGVSVPANAVDPRTFFARTRRHTLMEKAFTYSGQSQEVVELRKSDILSGILIRFSGQVVIANGGGSTNVSYRWPYDLIKQCRFTANGSANVINCSGLKLKARDIMKKSDLTDRGVSQTFGGVARTQGTLARAAESWGVAPGGTAIANGTYDIQLEWWVPVAEDEVDLTGAIYLATSSSDLTLTLDFENLPNLFLTSGGATATLTGGFQVITSKFSIPVVGDSIVVPDLSLFHSMIQYRVTGLQNGENEPKLVGQGAGKALLRVFGQTWNGAGTAAAPLPMNTTNFGKQSWRFGNNETPDEFIDGNHMRFDQERRYNCDVGALWGFFCHDFAHENAFRDVVDMGTTSELRLLQTIQSGVATNQAAMEYVTETVFQAGQAA